MAARVAARCVCCCCTVVGFGHEKDRLVSEYPALTDIGT